MSAHLVAVMGRGVVEPDSPVVAADDLGFIRGDGCFDSLRVVTDEHGSRAINLDEHLARLEHSAAALEIQPPTREAWRALVADALAAWTAPGEAAMKLILTRGREWALGEGPSAMLTITARPPASPPGLPLTATLLTTGHPSDAFADAPWLLGGVKTLSYAIQVASVREAKRRGVDDAILTTTDGFALEGTTSGLIVVRDGVLLTTPRGATGILASTTVDDIARHAHDNGMPVSVELIPVDDLFTADGVFLVSSSRGPCPVVSIDGRPLTRDEDLCTRIARYAGF